MGINMFGWLKRENFVLPPEEYQRKLVREIEEKLKDSKGSEKTKLKYMLENQLMILNQIINYFPDNDYANYAHNILLEK